MSAPVLQDGPDARSPLLTACVKCSAAGRPAIRIGTGPHSPHYVERDGRQVLVDCAGDEVPRAPPPEPVRCSARSPQAIQCRLTAGHAGSHRAVRR